MDINKINEIFSLYNDHICLSLTLSHFAIILNTYLFNYKEITRSKADVNMSIILLNTKQYSGVSFEQE